MKYLILLPALIHVYFFVLESVLWNTPFGRRAFQMDEAHAEATKVLAFNQGFYNLFLALGVLVGFGLWVGFPAIDGGPSAGFAVMVFSLGSMFAAGLVLIASSPAKWVGALLQLVPAVLGLGLSLAKIG